jgi:hypothetical protein
LSIGGERAPANRSDNIQHLQSFAWCRKQDSNL